MAGVIATLPKFQFSNALGLPMSGGTLTSYLAGTTTLATTYQNEALTTANTNPIALDSRGECVIWLDSTKTYKFELRNALGVLQWTVDNVTGAGALADRLRTDLGASTGSGLVGYLPAGTGAVATTVQEVLRESVGVTRYGADSTGSADSTAAFVAAASHNGKVFAPAGTYSIDTVAASSLHIIGEGIGKTVIRLRSASTATLFNVSTLKLEDLTLSDSGRTAMDHSADAAYLCECVDVFDARRVEFLTDRSVLLQTAASADSYTNIEDCKLARVTAAVANEYEGSNIFTILDSRCVNFVNLRTSGDLVGRSIVNATCTQTAVGTNNPVIANVERCHFAMFRHNGLDVDAEVKVLFLQGYLARVVLNQFVDCFGRHVDILSNYDSGSANGALYKSLVESNKIDFTTANALIAGSAFNEPGSIYCRYADVVVSGNHQNFSNLTLSSNVYNAISVRHGYKSAVILGNTIISPKAYAINADISDLIDTDECNVSIRDNVIQNATNNSRRPIFIGNNAATKTFDTVVIEGNSIEYSTASSAIELNSSPARASSFAVDALTVTGNWNKTFNTFDVVNFQSFPEYIFAPNTDVTISVNPAGANAAGVITSLSDAIAAIGRYRCNAVTIGLAAAVTTTQTITGPTTVTVRSRKAVINGNNGVSGRIRFYSSGAQQQNISFVLSGGDIDLNGCILNSDSGTSTTSLVSLSGWGHCLLKDCDAQYGEYFVDSLGPDFSIKGGTVNDINLGNSGSRAIVQTQLNRNIRCSIEDTTGASNTRLYNFLVPTFFAYENISVGSTVGNKTYTLVV